jgi:hypothetical protein
MKKLFALFLVTIFINAFAFESLTLPRSNLSVKMGELTGAGTRFTLKSLAGFVHPNGVIMKEDCQTITVKQSDNPMISDIVKIKVQNEEIKASELTGFIIENK